MDSVVARVGLIRSLNFRERLGVFAHALVNACQSVMCAGKLRVQPQCLTEIFLRLTIILPQKINQTQLIVTVCDIRLNRDVLQKFLVSTHKILFPVVRNPKIEMHEWKLGVGAGCGLQFVNSLIVLFAIEVSLSHKQMQFRRVLADFKQAAKSALLEVGVLRLSSRYAKRVEVIQLI